jgi:hypothetical protein
MGIGLTMADQSGGRVRPKHGPLNWRWVAALMVVLAAFLGLRGLRALQPEPVAAPMRTGTVVVVGVTDLPRSSLTGSDRVVIAPTAAQFSSRRCRSDRAISATVRPPGGPRSVRVAEPV